MDQYSQEFPEECFDLPPDDFSQVRGKEKVFNSDDFRAPEPKKPSKPQKVIPPITSVTKPASELLKPKETETGIPISKTSTKVHKQGRKPVGDKPLTASERKKLWRSRHGEEAKRKERIYLQEWRKKRKVTK